MCAAPVKEFHQHQSKLLVLCAGKFLVRSQAGKELGEGLLAQGPFRLGNRRPVHVSLDHSSLDDTIPAHQEGSCRIMRTVFMVLAGEDSPALSAEAEDDFSEIISTRLEW